VSVTDGEANGLLALATLERFLEEDGWHPQRLGDKPIYRMGFAGRNGRFACYAQVRIDLEQLVFYVMVPVKAPEEQRPLVAEFVTRANYGLRIGNFELDYGDGEVRFKSSLHFEGVPLDPRLIRAALEPAVTTLDRYLPGLMAVIYGGQSPLEAIGQIEG
jgi:hypothetical protein